jgi:cystathionine beta-synthase
VQPGLEFVLADPQGSILADYVKTGKLSAVSGSWAVEGIGEDFIPAIADLSRVKTAYSISDEESFNTARELLRQEGILAGSSTGTLLAAALRYCRAQATPKRVVTFVCDTGTRYLTKVYSDGWMVDQGLLHRPTTGDLRDLIGRRFDDGEVVTVSPTDTLLTAFNRMRSADLAQLPVVDNKGKLVGLIDESDLLLHVTSERERFGAPVLDTMTTDLKTLKPSARMRELREILDRGLTAVIADGDHFYGLITRFDLLNHLRRTLT